MITGWGRPAAPNTATAPKQSTAPTRADPRSSTTPPVDQRSTARARARPRGRGDQPRHPPAGSRRSRHHAPARGIQAITPPRTRPRDPGDHATTHPPAGSGRRSRHRAPAPRGRGDRRSAPSGPPRRTLRPTPAHRGHPDHDHRSGTHAAPDTVAAPQTTITNCGGPERHHDQRLGTPSRTQHGHRSPNNDHATTHPPAGSKRSPVGTAGASLAQPPPPHPPTAGLHHDRRLGTRRRAQRSYRSPNTDHHGAPARGGTMITGSGRPAAPNTATAPKQMITPPRTRARDRQAIAWSRIIGAQPAVATALTPAHRGLHHDHQLGDAQAGPAQLPLPEQRSSTAHLPAGSSDHATTDHPPAGSRGSPLGTIRGQPAAPTARTTRHHHDHRSGTRRCAQRN